MANLMYTSGSAWDTPGSVHRLFYGWWWADVFTVSNPWPTNITVLVLHLCRFFFIGNRQLGNLVRFLARNRQPQTKKNRQPGGPILGPANLGNFQIRQIRQNERTNARLKSLENDKTWPNWGENGPIKSNMIFMSPNYSHYVL